jgi:hypothetical protein
MNCRYHVFEREVRVWLKDAEPAKEVACIYCGLSYPMYGWLSRSEDDPLTQLVLDELRDRDVL